MGQYATSATWMIGDKIVNALCQLGALFLLSNHLGAYQFGELIFAYSLCLAFSSLSLLGLEQILVKRMVETSSEAMSILYHGTLCRILAGILSFFLTNWVAAFFHLTEDGQCLVFIISLIHLVLPFDTAGLFFQAKVMGKYSAIAFMVAYVAGFALRALFIFYDVPLYWYGFCYVFEIVLSSFLMWWLFFVKYKKTWKVKLRFSLPLSLSLLKSGAPLILSGVIVFLYLKIDQMMLQAMLGANDVGVYAAATRLSEAWVFFTIPIFNAYFPKIVKAKNSEEGYEKDLIKLGSTLCAAGILLSIGTCLISERLIAILYSSEYTGATNVLNITIWIVVFSVLGGISSRVLVVENMQKFLILRSVIGLLVNVILNLWLIPIYGIEGAAIATLVAQIGASFLSHMCSRQLWYLFKIQLRCLLCLGLLPYYRDNLLNK